MGMMRAAAAAAIALAACAAGARAQTLVNGWESYARGTPRIICRDRPVLLTGSHTDLMLSGPCRYVRLAGNHNDVTLTIAPGATIEITGAHNDVFWRLLDPGATHPILLDRGYSNTFHRRTGEE